MTLQEARLTLKADVGPDAGKDTGVFRLYGDPEVSEFVRAGYVLGGSGSTINAIVQEQLSTEDGRRGVYLDLGGGVHGWEIDFRTWEDATDENNDDVTWGDTSYASPSRANATGADALTQQNVFMAFLNKGRFGSDSNDAIFEYGEYSESGAFGPKVVVPVQQPQLSTSAQEPGFTRGKLVLVEAQGLKKPSGSTEDPR